MLITVRSRRWWASPKRREQVAASFQAAALLALLSAFTSVASAETSAQTLYLLQCSGCHGPQGEGDPRVDVPPFPGFIGSFLRDPEGRRYVTNVGGVMSAGLNDHDTARVLNWLLETFAGKSLPSDFKKFDAAEVRHLRDTRPADAVALRRQIAARLMVRGIKLPAYPWP
jgi:mono/diheme cytochrome c family protein